VTEQTAVGTEVPSTTTARLVFTGRGGEYFRIWVVNLLLTVVTVGLYSAWTKVRKARYFAQNTRLDGHVFGYHGNPRAILRGRIIALVLLGAYSWGFQFSRVAGLVTLGMLCAAGPWLFMRSQQFRLGNTSFRGLRFGFDARVGEAYRILLPILVLWFAPTIVAALAVDESWQYGLVGFLGSLAIPWMHHRLKAYQHGRAMYGDRSFAFLGARRKFYGVYLKGVGLVLLGGMLGSAVAFAIAWARGPSTQFPGAGFESAIYGGIIMLPVYLFAWPFLAARLQQAVWTNTRLGDVRFRTEIKARSLFGIVFRSVMLTLLTCGLYWPFAAVALARYRIECVRIDSEMPLAAIAVDLHGRPVAAFGEGATDTFGLDLGL
jgi:uncharacterized membrane protein YjgN (DUF898 family)